ncbi:hypothetical protein ACJMK2_008116, partial [Sinanodonta woodiana]
KVDATCDAGFIRMSCLTPSPCHVKTRVRNALSEPHESKQKTSKLKEIINCMFFRRKKADVVDMLEEEKQAILPKGRKIHIDRSGKSRKALKMETMKDGPVQRRIVKSAPSTPCGTRHMAFLPSENPTAAFMSYLSPKDRTIRHACSTVSRSYSTSNLGRLHARQAFLQTQQQQRRHVITSRRSSDIPLYKRRPWQMGADDLNIGITKVSRTDKQKLETYAPGVISDSKGNAFNASTDDIYDLHEEMRRMRLSNPVFKLDDMSTSKFIEKKKVQGSDQELVLVHDESKTSSPSPISVKSAMEGLYQPTQQIFGSFCPEALNSSNKNEQGGETYNTKKPNYMHQGERRIFDENSVTREGLDERSWTMDEDDSETKAEEDQVSFHAESNSASYCINMEHNSFLMKNGENDFTGEIHSNKIDEGEPCIFFMGKKPFDGGLMKVTPVMNIENEQKRNLTLKMNNINDSENGSAQLNKMDIRLNENEDDDSDLHQSASPIMNMITDGDATDDSKLVPSFLRPRSQRGNLINNSEQPTRQDIHTHAVKTELYVGNIDYCKTVNSNGILHGQHIPPQIDGDESFSSEWSETSEIMNVLKEQCDQRNIMDQRPLSVSRSSSETLTPAPNVSSTHSFFVQIPPCQSDINSSRQYISSKNKATLFLHNEDLDKEEEKRVIDDNMRMMQTKSGTNSSSQSTIKSLNAEYIPPLNKFCIKPKTHVRHGQLQPLEIHSLREQNKNRLPFKDVEMNFSIGIGSDAMFGGTRTVKNVRLDPIQRSQSPVLEIPLRMDNTNGGNTERYRLSSELCYGSVPCPRSEMFGRNIYSNGYGNLNINHSHNTGYKGLMDSKPDDSSVQSLPPAMIERKDKHLNQCMGYSVNDTSSNYDTDLKHDHSLRGNKDRDYNTKENHVLNPIGKSKITEAGNNLHSLNKPGFKIKPIHPRETRRGIKLEWLLKDAAETEV